MSGEVPHTKRDVEWYALWMTHEYVHFVQWNVAGRRSHGGVAVREGFATLISHYAADFGGDRIIGEYADVGCGCGRELVQEEGLQGRRWVRPLHVIAASALRAGEMPSIRSLLAMEYGPYSGWSSPLSVFLLYRLPASFLGFIDERFGRDTLVELFRTTPEALSTRTRGRVDQKIVYAWFERCTGAALDQLEAEWHAFLTAVEVDECHVGAIRLLKAAENIGLDSLFTRVRGTMGLDPGFLKAWDGLLDDIHRYGRKFGMPDWRGEKACCGAYAGLTEELLRERIAQLAGWADQLGRDEE